MVTNYVSYLIAQNMDIEKIKRMSLKQIDAVVEIFDRRERKDLVNLASCMRMSQAEGKDWKSFIRDLQKG